MVIVIHDDDFERDYNKRCNAANLRSVYPDAVVVLRVTGGYALFSSYSDFETWKKQK